MPKKPKPQDQNSGKKEALKSALSQIEKEFGSGAVIKLGAGNQTKKVEAIKTGSIALDLALGIGGIPKGRIVEIYGPESSGKTTLVLHIIAEAQKQGGLCAFIDAEHALDAVYAKRLGVDIDNLYISQPDTGEQALEIAEKLIRSGALDVIAIDSVAALTPKAEIEGEMGDSHMGLQARLMSQALRKITGAINKANTTVIFTNQIREKIGVMFGNPETTTGGRALKFYASVRLDIRRIGSITEGDKFIGNRVKVKVVKNKVAPPFRIAEFDIMFNEGISKEGNLVDVGVEFEILKKSGSWYSYKGENIAQGRESAKEYLRENPKIAKEIEEAIIKKALKEEDVLELGTTQEETA
ncbi:MAG TPA: recombinase RecA [candidate division WWE3 bacterium]|uniref:Protein RecA n=1 Tax=candidate division WWE3 bacterium TaxID=2053526 RepID=A0A7V5J018_UNCKA|nr:recombinase RecA [candidate division WWE3 bacterium]